MQNKETFTVVMDDCARQWSSSAIWDIIPQHAYTVHEPSQCESSVW